IISPLPPVLAKTRYAARPLRSMGVTPLLGYYEPNRHRLAVSRFPGVAGYTAYPAPPIARSGEDGFSSCSTCPCHRAIPTTLPGSFSRITSASVSRTKWPDYVTILAVTHYNARDHSYEHPNC